MRKKKKKKKKKNFKETKANEFESSSLFNTDHIECLAHKIVQCKISSCQSIVTYALGGQ